jgi:hypothetical protein
MPPIPHPPWCTNPQHGAEVDHVGRFEVVKISDSAALTMVVKQDPRSDAGPYAQWQLMLDGAPISTVPIPMRKLREIKNLIGAQLGSLQGRGRRGNGAPSWTKDTPCNQQERS